MRKSLAVLAAALVVVVAGCGGSHAINPAGTGSPYKAGTCITGPSFCITLRQYYAEQTEWDNAHPGYVKCVADVWILIDHSYANMQHGGSGIATDQVGAIYGYTSAIFYAYSTIHAQLQIYVGENGVQNTAATVIGTIDMRTLAPEDCLAGLGYPASDHFSPYPAGPPAGVTGCPNSAQLLAVWKAESSASRSWTTIPISGFKAITCWRGWIVTEPIANADGLVVFRQHNGLHLLPETELRQFNSAICPAADSPADWQGPAGPASCSPAQPAAAAPAPTSQPTSPGPELPGYASALSTWTQTQHVTQAYCLSFLLRAADDLKATGNSRYAAAIRTLTNLASIPSTGLTTAQSNEGYADVEALNRFFHTPGLVTCL